MSYRDNSVQFSCSVMSEFLQPDEPQHTRPPCPSPTPRVHPNPCPLSRWCHPAISSSVVPFSSCLQSFPGSGSFPVSQLCIRCPKYLSFIFSISASNDIHGWFPVGLTIKHVFIFQETDFEAETPILWTPHAKSWLTWNDPDAGERLRAGRKGDDRGWDSWIASPTQWTWVWASSGSWWWTGKPGMLQSMRSQRIWHDRATELNWNHPNSVTVEHNSWTETFHRGVQQQSIKDFCIYSAMRLVCSFLLL